MKKASYIVLLTTFIYFCLIATSCTEDAHQPATLVLLNGNVITVDADFSQVEAVAVSGNRIVAVGSNEDIRSFIGPDTDVIDLDGATVLPGLIDAHAHLVSLGEELTRLNISGAGSYDEIVTRIEERVSQVKPGDWILGGRWDHTDWEPAVFPVHDPLSAVSLDNPVYLTRVDGNSAFVNAKALELAGIDSSTPDPPGGKIIRKANGEPTGVLVNQAMNLVKDLIPPNTVEEQKKKLLLAVEDCLSVGLTGVHEAGVGPDEIAAIKELIDEHRLGLRVYAMLGEQEKPTFQVENLEEYFRANRIDSYGDHFLSVRSIKLYFDGALGSRGAAFFEPYEDDPDNRGLFRMDPEYITEVSIAALKTGMGVNTHCIGIRGNAVCLESYAVALKQFPDVDHRFRIEHAQIIRKEDVARFKELGIIPAMQPTHCTSDMNFVAARIGEDRSEGAYAWRWFIDAGLTIPCGSDFPVESTNPFHGIYAAITRQDPTGNPEGGWHPEQKMTRKEALKGFTIWAAHAAFQEDILGSIEVGKLGDFTIIDRNILEVPEHDILSTKVLYTIVNGRIHQIDVSATETSHAP
jgi:predicted amidohydrolase YtcJ